jgi:hypothetical protein
MPHMQIRSRPASTPHDLEKFLRPLAEAGVNIIAAGGSSIELDGEIGISVAHEDFDEAERVLQEAGYVVERAEVYECWMDNVPGELRRCIAEASAENLESGRVIKDIAIGVPREEDGRMLVQVYSVDVRTQVNTEEPPAS